MTAATSIHIKYKAMNALAWPGALTLLHIKYRAAKKKIFVANYCVYITSYKHKEAKYTTVITACHN